MPRYIDFRFDWQWHQHIVIDLCWCWLMLILIDADADSDTSERTIIPRAVLHPSLTCYYVSFWYTFSWLGFAELECHEESSSLSNIGCQQSDIKLPPWWSNPTPKCRSPWRRPSWRRLWRRPPPTHEAATWKWSAQLPEEALPRRCWSRCVACESWREPSCWVLKIPSQTVFLIFSISAPSAPCSSLATQCPHTDMELVQELASFSLSDSFNGGLSRPKRGATIHKFYAHEAYGQETHPLQVVPQPRKRRRLRWVCQYLFTFDCFVFVAKSTWYILVCLPCLVQGAPSQATETPSQETRRRGNATYIHVSIRCLKYHADVDVRITCFKW